MNFTIRPAQKADAPFLSETILLAGWGHLEKGIWDVILGGSREENQAFLQVLTLTDPPHLFHYKQHLIIEVDGKPAAALGGYDPREAGYPKLQEAMPGAFRLTGRSPLNDQDRERMGRVLPCIPESLAGAWIIENVATLPEYRGLGLAGRLLESILDRGRELGFKLTQLSIYIGNTPAQRLYEKYGFRVIDENRCPDFEREIGSPGMARMTRGI